MNIKKSIITSKCNLNIEIQSNNIQTHSMIEDHPKFKELIESTFEELRSRIIDYEVGFYRQRKNDS